MKSFLSIGAVVLVAIAIYFLTYSPKVKMVLACDKDENCVDLYGKPSIGIAMGAAHFWGIGRAEDPAGHCRNGCTVKVIYDQAGDNDLTQTEPSKRPAYCYGRLCSPPEGLLPLGDGQSPLPR